MCKYQVFPLNENSYLVFADNLVIQGDWILFFKNELLIHACNRDYVRFVHLMTEEGD